MICSAAATTACSAFYLDANQHNGAGWIFSRSCVADPARLMYGQRTALIAECFNGGCATADLHRYQLLGLRRRPRRDRDSALLRNSDRVRERSFMYCLRVISFAAAALLAGYTNRDISRNTTGLESLDGEDIFAGFGKFFAAREENEF